MAERLQITVKHLMFWSGWSDVCSWVSKSNVHAAADYACGPNLQVSSPDVMDRGKHELHLGARP
eukprot:1139793-Pelagomonas_calceolata.AAC.6